MHTACNQPTLAFAPLAERRVEASFDAGRVTSDGGALLLRDLARRLDFFGRVARCFQDDRDPELVEFTLEELLAQRVLGIALGYEDLNDHDTLRDDALLACTSGREDVTGAHRRRPADRGHALAGKSTLNRLESLASNVATGSRYHKVTCDAARVEDLLVELFLEAHPVPPGEIVLDFDATDDPLHGRQEGRFFHGYYGHYCYLPLYVFAGDHLLVAKLRTADRDGADGALDELRRLVSRIREAWPSTRVVVRGDSGFCRDAIMAWCEDNGVSYILGLARNARLSRAIETEMAAARAAQAATGSASRVFRDFRYSTLDSWTRERRVVGKAEKLEGKENPRFVVTNLAIDAWGPRALYEDLYCARGDMENRIKEQQLQLFADRLSTARMHGNQLRLWFSSLAYVLLAALRRVALSGTELARAEVGTIRLRLLKIGGVVRASVRRVHVALSSVHPGRDLFVQALDHLKARLKPRRVT